MSRIHGANLGWRLDLRRLNKPLEGNVVPLGDPILSAHVLDRLERGDKVLIKGELENVNTGRKQEFRYLLERDGNRIVASGSVAGKKLEGELKLESRERIALGVTQEIWEGRYRIGSDEVRQLVKELKMRGMPVLVYSNVQSGGARVEYVSDLTKDGVRVRGKMGRRKLRVSSKVRESLNTSGFTGDIEGKLGSLRVKGIVILPNPSRAIIKELFGQYQISYDIVSVPY